MTNLVNVLPDLDLSPYAHILPSLEKALVSTADLLTLEALDVAKRAHVPAGEVTKLCDALLVHLHASTRRETRPTDETSEPATEPERQEGACVRDGLTLLNRMSVISTLDETLDAALDGGVVTGYITEFVGESAAGKTQCLLTLLLSVQLAPPQGLGKSALYISTEAPLQTSRLTQILATHPKLATLPAADRPSLNRIQSTHIHDVEAQEHILRFQVPVMVEKANVGLLVVDSIAANFRAEFDKGRVHGRADSFAKRSAQLLQLGYLLQSIARDYGIAVVVANQVADRFEVVTNDRQKQGTGSQMSTQNSHGPDSPRTHVGQHIPPPTTGDSVTQTALPSLLSTDDCLSLDHQQRFFTGWGDEILHANTTTPIANDLKTPSLGLTWTNQLAARIALLKQPIYNEGRERNTSAWKRSFKIVFSSWCAPGIHAFEIWEGGIRGLLPKQETEEIDATK